MITADMAIVIALMAVAVVLFASDRIRVDIVALLIMLALLATGILTPEEGLLGFSNTATVTIAAMFVLSAGLFRTGAVNFFGIALGRIARKSPRRALILIMITIGVVSAFINNTAAVAIFMPIVLGFAREARISPTKLLMPLSFASMLGGTATLIGTSTNILVNSIAVRHGLEPLRMFEFTPFGIILFIVGTAYMLLIGVKLIPSRRTPGELVDAFAMDHYLADVILIADCSSIGRSLAESPLVRDLDIDVLEVLRNKRVMRLPSAFLVLKEGDVLRVRGDVDKIRKLQKKEGVELRTDVAIHDDDLTNEETILVEAVVAPNSSFVGRSMRSAHFRNVFGATVLAMRHHTELLHDNLGNATLRAGDVLLLEIHRSRLDALRAHDDFVLMSEVDVPRFRPRKIIPALIIVGGVILTAALGVFPIVMSAVLGCVLMILTRCIEPDEAYESIDWKVIILLAGVLSLGTALEKTGGAQLISDVLISSVGSLGNVAVVSAFFLLTTLLTSVMSNGATAALLAPVAITTAASLGVSPRPLLMAVTFAASISFMTPMGYQTNTIIFGPGQYKFQDFLRVGTPLNILLWIAGTICIPIFWPL